MSKVIAYTDGASRGNPGPGVYGAVLISGKFRKELSGGYKETTNNRMELLSVIKVLEALKFEGTEIQIYSDSKYVVDAVNKGWVFGWAKKGFAKKANADLWRRFLQVYPKHKVQLIWVKGHAGIPENERCDFLATQAALNNPSEIDHGFQES